MNEDEIRDGSGPGGGLRTGHVQGAGEEKHASLDERKVQHRERAAQRQEEKQRKQDEQNPMGQQIAELHQRIAALERQLRQFRISSSDSRVTIAGNFPHMTIKVRETRQ
jgi:flagellar motility protein MotE (MotC chaperone)